MTIANASHLQVDWTTSSYSGGNNNCVQAAALPGRETAVRDSKVSGGAALVFAPGAWGRFLAGIRDGVL